MKQFVFTLQSLYDMQDGIEKQVKMQMSAVEAELARQIQEMERISASFDRTKSEYCSAVAAESRPCGSEITASFRTPARRYAASAEQDQPA
jgi:phage host-nuclease inhibitor protein Gam